MEGPKLKIGDTVKIGKSIYTIMAEFEDTYNLSYKKEPITEHLYVGRKTVNGQHYYSNIIAWNINEGKWYIRS